MRNTLKIVERVRSMTEKKTDYAVAKMLGMQQSNLARVIAGERLIGNKAAFKAAKLLKLDPADVIALIELDRAESAEDRAFWEGVCPPSIRSALDAAGVETPSGAVAETEVCILRQIRFAIDRLWYFCTGASPAPFPA